MDKSTGKRIIISVIIAAVIIMIGVGVRLLYSRYGQDRTVNDTGLIISPDERIETIKTSDPVSGAGEGTSADPDSAQTAADSSASVSDISDDDMSESDDDAGVSIFEPDSVSWVEATKLDIDTLMEHPEILTSMCTAMGGSDYHYYVSGDMADQKVTFVYNTDIAVTGYVHAQPMSIDQGWSDSGEFVLDRYGAPANESEYDIQDIPVNWYMYDGADDDTLIAEWNNSDRIYTLILQGEDLSGIDIKELVEQSLPG